MVNRDSKVIAKFVRIFTSIFDRKKKWILKVIGAGVIHSNVNVAARLSYHEAG
jgi:hypothetical protein